MKKNIVCEIVDVPFDQSIKAINYELGFHMIQSWILGTPIWTVSVVATSEEDDITNLSRSSGVVPRFVRYV